MTDFNYKKYSLENLENWMYDALDSSGATPQEIYDTIKKVVVESRSYHKDHGSRAYELMCLLNGNGKGHIKEFDDCVDKILSCDKNDHSPECKKSWVDFWEETYYPEESKQYTEEELNAMCDKAASDVQKDKVTKWSLPVQQSEDEYYVEFPDDLLEAANLKQGDFVEWVNLNNGNWQLRKVTKPLGMDEC